MKTLERRLYAHISDSIQIVDFEWANICWVHIGKTSTYENKIGYIMRYVVVF